MTKEEIIDALHDAETKTGIMEIICDTKIWDGRVIENTSCLVFVEDDVDDSRIIRACHWYIFPSIDEFIDECDKEIPYCITKYHSIHKFKSDFI